MSGLRRSFVGRDDELRRLLAAYRAAVEERRPRLVTILGDAGVGKTRLVRELWERLSDESHEPIRRTGRCLPYGQGITYWPLAEVLREHLGLLESDPAEVVLERLGERRLLGLALGLDVAEGAHPLLVRDRFQDGWAEFFADASAERPLVVLIEDLHWADDQLLDLLERLAEDVQGPLLLLATARPELMDARPGWSRAGGVIELQALSAEDSLQLLDELLTGELPGGLRDLVLERAEGNPFFVEEVLETLIDRGLLERENGGWRLAELPPDFEVPDSVQAVLSARIDLLEPTEKEALQAAAVIGRVFWAGPIYELVQGEPDLRVLEERDLVRRRSGSTMAGEREYAIKHGLTREVAYASLPRARRARLHAAFAGWLERLGERDELASLLAHHYAEAVRPEDADLAWQDDEAELERLRMKAVAWLGRAGDLATSRYELDDAIELFGRALELETRRPQQARLWHRLGRAHALKYDATGFFDAMEKAIEHCEDDALKGELYADLALDTAGRGGMFPVLPEVDVVEAWVDRALELADPESPAAAKALIARAHWRRSTGISTGLAEAEVAFPLAERLGDLDLLSAADVDRVFSLVVESRYADALAGIERAKGRVGRVKDPDLVADVAAASAFVEVAAGRIAEARASAALHEDLASRLTPHHRVHGVAISAELEETIGNWPGVARLEGLARERVAANLETPCIRNARTLLLCAIAAEHDGDRERSTSLEELAREVELEGFDATLRGPKTRLALVRGELDLVERLVADRGGLSASTWFRLSNLIVRLDALVLLGRRDEVEQEAAPALEQPGSLLEPVALRALGLVREDEQLIERALRRFEALGLDWYAEETRRLVAQA